MNDGNELCLMLQLNIWYRKYISFVVIVVDVALYFFFAWKIHYDSFSYIYFAQVFTHTKWFIFDRITGVKKNENKFKKIYITTEQCKFV